MTVAVTTEPGIGRIELDHPPFNILTRDVLRGLREQLQRLAEQPDLRVLLLTATGDHFSAGADVGEHLPPHHLSLIPEFLDTVAALDAFPVPVVAGVRGKCVGGGFELVQPVDLIIAGRGASFGQPEIVLGVFPPAACVLLPGRLPPALVSRMIYSGESISAAEAERWGLIVRVVPDEDVEQAALEEARRIARHSAVALRAAKRALRGSGAATRHAALRGAGQVYLHELMETHDAVEGLRAFTDKRRPVWKHV
jgi:cyclohexa-1,5-dienecarbonyl-CoA hydratase